MKKYLSIISNFLIKKLIFEKIISLFEFNDNINLRLFNLFYKKQIYKKNFERKREVTFLLEIIHDLVKKKNKISLLDVGFAGSWYILDILKADNIDYTGLDINNSRITGLGLKVDATLKKLWNFMLSKIKYIYADIIDYKSKNKYDLVISISTIEHILPLGYDSKKEYGPYLDIDAVDSMKNLVKEEGYILLTFPCGTEEFFVNRKNLNFNFLLQKGFKLGHHNLISYDENRIKKIIGDWKVIKEKYFMGKKFNPIGKTSAINYEHKSSFINSLCCILLKNPK